MKGHQKVQLNKMCNSIVVLYRVVKFCKTINYCEMVGISRPDGLVGEGV